MQRPAVFSLESLYFAYQHKRDVFCYVVCDYDNIVEEEKRIRRLPRARQFRARVHSFFGTLFVLLLCETLGVALFGIGFVLTVIVRFPL